MDSVKIETVGSLIKIDQVTTVLHHIVPNTLVLETIEPYPSYHGDVPSGIKPNLIFLITSEDYPVEYIMRLTNRLRKYFPFAIDATPATLKIYNDNYFGIRIRGLLSFDQIKQIQESFLSEGLRFMKIRKINAPALIHLKKPYILNEYQTGIFKDLIEPMMWYFSMPEKLEWNMLHMFTNNIKNNIENTNFDVAFGWIFLNGVTDIIRIYANNLKLEDVVILQNKYLDELRKYHKL